MSYPKWKVSYKDHEGGTGNVVIDWPDKPSRDLAVFCTREHLLGESYLIIDKPQVHSKPTGFALDSSFEMTGLEQIKA